jgi:hypothetical protein
VVVDGGIISHTTKERIKMTSEVLVETVLDRVAEILYDLKDDDRWADELIEIAGEGNRKEVKATVSHIIGTIENEI